MKQTIYILTFFTLLTACNSKKENNGSRIPTETLNVEQNRITKSKIETEQDVNSVNCDFIYDTITDKKYRMHLRILDKFQNKDKRGFYFNQNGDTLNNFLYHQDIAAFTGSLDSTETGVYNLLTNMVVNLIVAEDPAMLDYGLPPNGQPEFKYFLKHVGDLKCGKIDFDKVIIGVEAYMNTPHKKAEQNKKILLNKLNEEKKRHTNNG